MQVEEVKVNDNQFELQNTSWEGHPCKDSTRSFPVRENPKMQFTLTGRRGCKSGEKHVTGFFPLIKNKFFLLYIRIKYAIN